MFKPWMAHKRKKAVTENVTAFFMPPADASRHRLADIDAACYGYDCHGSYGII